MFERFSDRAREAMVVAQAEAHRLRYPWLGTEHLLMALLRQPGTTASRALAGLGVSAGSVEQELIRTLGAPPEEQTLGQEEENALRIIGIDLQEVRRRVEETFGPAALDCATPGRCGWPMMPRLKETLQLATREAGSGSVETDHLLLGMLRVRKALGVELLAHLGITPEAVRASIQGLQRTS